MGLYPRPFPNISKPVPPLPRFCLASPFPPNAFDRCSHSEVELWQQIEQLGGIRAVCLNPLHPYYPRPPWIERPRQGKEINKVGTIPLPLAIQEGTDKLVCTETVPLGYDGVINAVVNEYTGTGFLEGSGDITWRLQVRRAYAKDYGAIQVTLGSLTTPTALPIGIRLYSLDVISYYVNIAAGASARLTGGRIICAFSGWTYPR